jgi:hypothetical protein
MSAWALADLGAGDIMVIGIFFGFAVLLILGKR